jgi:hypothetical protein
LARSIYDDLHDRYQHILTTKSGTRYERLAALIFKSFYDAGVVIHDIKLVGDTGVEHQIYVAIDTNDNPRSILIECKDFDVKGKPVGLSIVRDPQRISRRRLGRPNEGL